jgi:hypothetical protein
VSAAGDRIDLLRSLDGRRHLGGIVDQPARNTVDDDFGRGSPANGDRWRATSHRLDHHKSERLIPAEREQGRGGAPQELRLFLPLDRSDPLNGFAQSRPDTLLEPVTLVVGWGRCRDDESAPKALGNGDCDIRAFIRMKAPEEDQVIIALSVQRKLTKVDAIVNAAHHVEVRQGLLLVIANRDVGGVREGVDDRVQVVQRREEWTVDELRKGWSNRDAVVVNNIAIGGLTKCVANVDQFALIESLGPFDLAKSSAFLDGGRGASRGKQSDLVATSMEPLGNEARDEFGRTVPARRSRDVWC